MMCIIKKYIIAVIAVIFKLSSTVACHLSYGLIPFIATVHHHSITIKKSFITVYKIYIEQELEAIPCDFIRGISFQAV